MPLHRAPLVMLVAPLLAVCAAGCATVARTAPATPPVGSSQDPGTVYARMSDAVRKAGGVHAVIETRTVDAPRPYVTVRNVWLNGTGHGREETLTTFWLSDTPVVRRASTIVDGATAVLSRDPSPVLTHEALTCRGAPDAAISLLAGCRGFLETSDTVVRDDGDARALVTTGVLAGAGTRTWFEDTLHIDAESGLPSSLDASSVEDEAGVTEDVRTSTTYRFEPYDASIAPGLFDPASLGDTAASPVAPLDDLAPGVPWPRLLRLPEGDLELASAFVVPDSAAAWLPYRAELSYRPAGDAFAPPVVALRLLRQGDVALYGAVALDTPSGVVVAVPAAPAVSRETLEAALLALAGAMP